MKKFSLKKLLVAVMVVAIAIAFCQREVEVDFVGNQPSDMRLGCPITLLEGDVLQPSKRIEGILIRYSTGRKFVAKIQMLDWIGLEYGQNYGLYAEELVFSPTVQAVWSK